MFDACSRHLNTLVYQCLVTACSMHRCDGITCSYAYSLDFFHNYTNPRRVTAHITTLVATSSITPVHNTPHHHFLFLKLPFIIHMSTYPLHTEPVFITPELITWLSFESIVSFFESLIHSWLDGTIDYFAFETSPFHHYLSSILSHTHQS